MDRDCIISQLGTQAVTPRARPTSQPTLQRIRTYVVKHKHTAHTSIDRSISEKAKRSESKRSHGAGGEGVRVGGVAVRGARAAVPGGGRRGVRARPHEPRGRRPPHPGLPRPEPLRPGPRPRGRRPHPLRIAGDREARAPQVQAGAAAVRRGRVVAGVRGEGGRVAGGGGAAGPPCDGRHRGAVHRKAAPRRHARPGRRGRERREAAEGAGGLRGAAVGVEVPRRGRRQPRRPQPLPAHALLHGDRVRAAGGGVPARDGVVGGAQGQAGGQEGHGVHAAGLRAREEGGAVRSDGDAGGRRRRTVPCTVTARASHGVTGFGLFVFHA